ncbi:hypothetical protein [Dyella acidiphila]|uniref:Uncharacterized protein n=1 Tax=Dyella acidiphila TaxID=2775866 RepID=A0ABR9GBF4_9GAMM|nr:hypothetical protein [Dyella acidiphila]MBE1161398.1 hypothetical protein [Dyella acidiphila]
MATTDDLSIEQFMQEFDSAIQKAPAEPTLRSQSAYSWQTLCDSLLRRLLEQFREVYNYRNQARIELTGDGVSSLGVVMFAMDGKSFPPGGNLRFSPARIPGEVQFDIIFLDKVVNTGTCSYGLADSRWLMLRLRDFCDEFHARALS